MDQIIENDERISMRATKSDSRMFSVFLREREAHNRTGSTNKSLFMLRISIFNFLTNCHTLSLIYKKSPSGLCFIVKLCMKSASVRSSMLLTSTSPMAIHLWVASSHDETQPYGFSENIFNYHILFY